MVMMLMLHRLMHFSRLLMKCASMQTGSLRHMTNIGWPQAFLSQNCWNADNFLSAALSAGSRNPRAAGHKTEQSWAAREEFSVTPAADRLSHRKPQINDSQRNYILLNLECILSKMERKAARKCSWFEPPYLCFVVVFFFFFKKILENFEWDK